MPKSIGKKFHEPAMKQKTREINIILIPDVQDYHEAKSIQNPMTPKLFNALMLQSILYTIAHLRPSKRCDAPVSIELPSNSPYYPAGKQIKTCFREQNKLSAEDGWTTDVRTNIHRYKTHEEANIHLEIINRYQKTIEQYYAINNEY